MNRITVFVVTAISCITAVAMPVLANALNTRDAIDLQNITREPQHILAMAYKDNLSTFAKTLRRPAGQSTVVNSIMTRAAVAEMRRSFDLMTQLFQSHMSYDMDTLISPTQLRMNTKIATIGYLLEELEREVSYNALDARRISEMTEKIIAESARLS